MDRTISICIPPPAATSSLRPCLPRSEVYADGIRYTVRPMVARSRHPAALGCAEGAPQQADGSPNAKGQPRKGRNESKTRRGVYCACWAACHGIRTLPDWKSMTTRVELGRLCHSIIRRLARMTRRLSEVGETSFDLVVPGLYHVIDREIGDASCTEDHVASDVMPLDFTTHRWEHARDR